MGSFKIDFDIMTYKHKGILPDIEKYMEHDEIINYDDHYKGNIEKCVWKKKIHTAKELSSPWYREREITRVLKTGAWMGLKDDIVWLPPPYYFQLQYGAAGSAPPEFRIKRLKHYYFKIEARNNPGCIGTFTVKNRQDGETTSSLTDAFWECLDGGSMNIGQIGIQSKTREDAQNPCWMAVQTLWQSLDDWIKKELCSDIVSPDNMAEKIEFRRAANDIKHQVARNIMFRYYPAVYNAMDGKSNMVKCILDECLKWVQCNLADTITNYKKFLMPGFERRGMFDMFSSPADKDCQSYRDGHNVWKDSDPNEIDPDTGTTKSRIHRYYSNPLEGILGAYDMWGDADPEQIYNHIMRERKNTRPDKLLEEIRGFPLNDEEMWGSIEGSKTWSNHEGIKQRSIYLIGARFKNAKTQDPKVVYGNLERADGYINGDVEFRMSDLQKFDKKEARFCFSYIPDPLHKGKLEDIFNPPDYVENVLGVDPYSLRYQGKDKTKQSLGAMVNRKFRDVLQTGINKVPTMIYLARPDHQDIFFEDVIKAAIFNRALIQYENRSDKLANYCEDRGYFNWLLPEIGAKPDSKRKGDAPSGRGAFLEEGMGLIDNATNKPLNPEEKYYLEQYWFQELIDDYLSFDPYDTHKNDLTMADMQALIGAVKIVYKKIRQPSEFNDAVMDYLFG